MTKIKKEKLNLTSLYWINTYTYIYKINREAQTYCKVRSKKGKVRTRLLKNVPMQGTCRPIIFHKTHTVTK